MINIVEKFLSKHNLNTPDTKIFVGFSGGCDSLCLLDIMKKLEGKYKFKLTALHLNHNWRGEESLQDEKNCKNFCSEQGIDYISETLDETGIKSETYAREYRYNFFIKHAKSIPNSCLMTAHTKSDNAETIIYRIIKGTGVKGLQGIPSRREFEGISIYRPLLNISRKEIEDYCNSNGLVPNNDSSNFDISYKRNFIRHKIMPLFDEINFSAENAIVSLSEIATSQINIVDEYMKIILKNISDGKKILTQKFMDCSEDVMQKIIYDILLETGLDYDRKKIRNILDFIKSNFSSKAGSTYSLTNNLWMFASSKYIYLLNKTKAEKTFEEISITTEGSWKLNSSKRILSVEKYNSSEKISFPPETADFALVDLGNQGLNLTFRTRRDGDLITPFGMNGTMRLKKYLNSKGIATHLRDELYMLCNGSEILWIPEVGLSNKIKVVNIPSHVIKFDNNR